jgi:Cwf15/Cwc15 cell cycle control protein
LKERKPKQGTAEELARKDFLAELEAKERKHFQLDKIEEFERACKLRIVSLLGPRLLACLLLLCWCSEHMLCHYWPPWHNDTTGVKELC